MRTILVEVTVNDDNTVDTVSIASKEQVDPTQWRGILSQLSEYLSRELEQES